MKKTYFTKIFLIIIILFGCITICNTSNAGWWSGNKYFYSAGKYYKNSYAYIKGILYHFNSSGNGKKYSGIYKKLCYDKGTLFTGVKNGKYYKMGVPATGVYQNCYYRNGSKPNGLCFVNSVYYMNGYRANGICYNKYYKNGKLATGIYKNVYYIKGVKATGIKTYKNKVYKNGKLLTGINTTNKKYYKEGVLGTGIYKNKYYKNGILSTDIYPSIASGKTSKGYVNGVLIKNKFKKFGDTTYYFNANGDVLKNNFKKINGKWYSFDKQGKIVLNGSTSITKIASACHKYLKDNGYTYNNNERKTIPLTKEKTADCSSFVSWVLYIHGYTKKFGGIQKVSSDFSKLAKEIKNGNGPKGWKSFSGNQEKSKLKEGDILVYGGHVEIYAGSGNKVYNIGATSHIKGSQPRESGHGVTNTTYVIRLP